MHHSLENTDRLTAELVDIDLQALAFVEDRAARENLRSRIKLHNANLVYPATGP